MATVSDVTNIPASGVTEIDALLDDGPGWNYLTGTGGNTVYYTYALESSYGGGVGSVSAFNAAQIAAADLVISYVESVTGINFVATGDAALAQLSFQSADVLLGDSVSGLCSWQSSYSLSGATVTSYTIDCDVFLDIYGSHTGNLAPTPGSTGYQVLLHEIGHALGLKHPFEGSPTLPAATDNTDNTLMSYTWVGGNKTAYMAYDLDALWWIYGGDGLGGTYGINSAVGPTLPGVTPPADTTPPTVSGFSPADEAAGVATDSNIVITFNESIQRGTGSILLKTAVGITVATYDAATSADLTISGATLTINPSADLLADTAYAVELAAGTIEDLAGNSYAGTSSYNFSTAAAADVTPPTVTDFSPADEVAGVSVDSDIVVSFDEEIQRGTGNILLKTREGILVATYDAASSPYLAIAGSTLTLAPPADLVYSTEYLVEFAAGTLQDLAGNAWTGATEYNFTTSAPPDTLPPVVLTFSPADEATAVPVGANIVLTFSEQVRRGSGTIVLLVNGVGTTVETFSFLSSRVQVAGDTVTIDPTSNLAYSTGYRLVLGADALRDLAGNIYAGTAAYNFTTQAIPDTVVPTVLNFSPADEATGVAIGSDIVIVFSEPVQRGTGHIVLKTADGSTIANYDASTSANLAISGNTLTISPAEDLTAGTGYTLELGAGTVKDLAGNAYAGTTGYNFTTQPEALSSATPGNDTLFGSVRNDVIDGLGGLDTVVYGGDWENYILEHEGNTWRVTAMAGSDGTDTLANVERLQFSEQSRALDLDGNAGTVAKILGAVFGQEFVANPTYVGIGLYFLDGGMDYAALMQLALDTLLGADAGHRAVVDLLFTNLVLRPPTDEEAAQFVGWLDSGDWTPATLGMMAAELSLNTDNIGLAGLADSGLAFVPLF